MSLVEVRLSDLVAQHLEDETKVIFHDINPPETPPYLESGTQLVDMKTEAEPPDEIDRAYGGRPNVPASNIVRAIRRDIGTSGYELHISDRSYTGYSIWEVSNFVRRYDNTNHERYIAEVFDCDDFAQVLQGNVNRYMKGIPLGTIWYYGTSNGKPWGHAVNIGYCHRQDKMYLIEPQNDKFYRFNKSAWRPGMIII